MFAKGIMLCLIIILHIHQCLNLCIEQERRALLKIEKDMFDPDNWLSSWRQGGDCCNWEGITCHNTTGHVIGLDLHYPYDWFTDIEIYAKRPSESKLNPSLADLKHLTYLNLSYNNFFGASIPIFIGSLTRLEHLDLSTSGFKGTIPPQLGNLSSLQVLNIGNGYGAFDLNLCVNDLHWISRLTSLTHLQTIAIDMSAAIDWIHDITKLPFITTLSFLNSQLPSIPITMPPLNNFTFLRTLEIFGSDFYSTIPGWLLNNISSLQSLSLGYCSLHGELPLLSGQVSNLKLLDLSLNKFDGEIIQHLNMLPLLEELHLDDNHINASISEILCNLKNLTYLTSLQLFENHIHGHLPKTLGNYNRLEKLMIANNNIVGDIPHSTGNLYKLTDLHLDNNNIGGEIPHSIGNLYKLTCLNMRGNNIEGEIPDFMGNLKKLEDFDVSKNHLSGKIPRSLFNLTNLRFLDLSDNNFWGEVPKSINLNCLRSINLSNNRLNGSIFFDNQSSFEVLDLSNNSFTGMFPFSGSISSRLVVINLSNNRFSGTIPNLFMFHPFLQSLQLGKNKLNGLIPSSLKYCKSLRFLDLSENKLCGKIPPWIGGTLLSLKVLNLRSNNFMGQIPRELSYLTSLQIMDLSHNHISGNFSLYFDNFTVMTKSKETDLLFYRFIDGIVYSENIWLNKQGTIRYYTRTLPYAIVIDVSNNEISGEIPNGITKLVGLTFLNLSWNHFVGNIPKNIGAIKYLEVLDLSSNKLSGEIPSTIGELSYLNTLNLSYNKLSGMIPTGKQLQTFTNPSIYTGNSNLCGWPLEQCFRSNSNSANFDGKENGHEYWYKKTWINAGTVVGFLTSSWGIFITLLFNKSMRCLHFYYIDKLYGLISLQFHIGIAKIKSKIMETEMH